MTADLSKASRFLAYVLRHKPDEIGLCLSDDGWASVADVLRGLRQHGFAVDRNTLAMIVAQDEKGRYSLSTDQRRIRANHGHSVPVAAGQPVTPPATLYHGTASRNLDSIGRTGIVPAKRRYVHLSDDPKQAIAVGRRHGNPVAIPVLAHSMHAAGHSFYHTASDVWLTHDVPPEFVDFAELIWADAAG